MLYVDWWSWKCARCDWKVRDQLTVNPQQAVAEALIRLHIQRHDQQLPAPTEEPKLHD